MRAAIALKDAKASECLQNVDKGIGEQPRKEQVPQNTLGSDMCRQDAVVAGRKGILLRCLAKEKRSIETKKLTIKP